MLKGKSVVIAVTGGIAAYKACELVSALKKLSADVFVIMTKNATEFVTPLTFEALCGNRVVVDTFDRNFTWEIEHVSVAKRADVFVVAPATANFIGKYACGIADDFVTSTIMATRARVLICPAMNDGMYLSPAVQDNIKLLELRGVYFAGPDSGRLACGDEGKGRLADTGFILERIKELLFEDAGGEKRRKPHVKLFSAGKSENTESTVRDFENKTVLVTAGATREEIDAVRYITNYSSGKMGIELAKAAYMRGAEVILVAGAVSIEIPPFINTVSVKTTEDMYNAVLKNMDKADIIIKAAAPADYKPAKIFNNKIKEEKLELKLVKNPDIAKAVGERKAGRKLVVFCAETENLEENAAKKLKSKHADMVVANNVLLEGAGFNTDTNIVSIIDKNGITRLDKMSKAELSDIILDKIKDL